MIIVKRILDLYIPLSFIVSTLLVVGTIILFAAMGKKKLWSRPGIIISVINLFLACLLSFNASYMKIHFFHAAVTVEKFLLNAPTLFAIVYFLVMVIAVYSIVFLISSITFACFKKAPVLKEMKKNE